MKIDGPRGRLYDAQQTIRAQWNAVTEFWGDANKADFEERVWEPLDLETSEALRAIDRLSKVLNECRRACAGEQR
jgi:hypothetical protein